MTRDIEFSLNVIRSLRASYQQHLGDPLGYVDAYVRGAVAALESAERLIVDMNQLTPITRAEHEHDQAT